MKDENNGVIMTEFVGLRAKMYSIKCGSVCTTKKIKGVKKDVIKNHIKFEDYLTCLREFQEIYRSQRLIRSYLHEVHSVLNVFRDVCRFWRVHSKNPVKIRRSVSEKDPISPDDTGSLGSSVVSPSSLYPYKPVTVCRFGKKRCTTKIYFIQVLRKTKKPNFYNIHVMQEQICQQLCTLTSESVKEDVKMLITECRARRWTDVEEEEEESESKGSSASSPCDSVPFRERASTDGHIQHKPWKWRYPPPSSNTSDPTYYSAARADRRMSISMKGNNVSY
ncbi:hypothetical protein NQ315_017329 [Exocentrus adspersus]|uniref:Uncharacterized protein n=1 Tax=Exocentrus adspersus TaxID=1586481 RepID=A0AAV8VEM4_9CUCU|nr:hypothetical protein NQ315_017329 [Exocentrus adspersus]